MLIILSFKNIKVGAPSVKMIRQHRHRTILAVTMFAMAALLVVGGLWRPGYAESILIATDTAGARSATGYSDHHGRSSQPIQHINWKWETLKTAAKGTDNFPMTWAADNHQYTMGGDGYGFELQNAKNSLILSKVAGPYDAQQYKDLWSADGKSYGLLALGERIYVWRGPGSGIKSFAETWLYEFDLSGQLLEKKRLFAQADRLCMPAFLQLGKDYQYAFDDWVYAYAIEPLPTRPFSVKQIWQEGGGASYVLQAVMGSPLWDVGSGNIWLMRVPRDHLMDRNAYQFFAGSVDGEPTWTTDIRSKQTVMQPAGNGLVSCAYSPWSNTYLFLTEHGGSFKSNLQILQSKYPWGPWHTLGKWNAWGEDQGIRPSLFYWNFAPKWFDSGGGAVIVYTGIEENDRYNCIRVRFERKNDSGG
jgi:hypothetical protein